VAPRSAELRHEDLRILLWWCLWAGVVFPLVLAGYAALRNMLSRERATIWREIAEGKRAPRKGLTVVHGTVDADGAGPAVEVLIVQKAEHWSYKGMPRTDWKECQREVHARPFYVVQKHGARVRVEPGERVMLIDELEPRDDQPERRTLSARLETGEPVHLLGILDRVPEAPGGGVYRDAAIEPTVRPPRRGRMLISTEPLDARATREADYYRSMRNTALGSIPFSHALLVSLYFHALSGNLHSYQPGNFTMFGFGFLLTLQFTVGLLFLIMKDKEWWQGRYKYSGGRLGDPFRDREREQQRERIKKRHRD
jgi:hypothetical protein